MTEPILARVRGLGRVIDRRLFHCVRPGAEPVDIWDLVSPLRYDIVVRAQYFSFFSAHRTLFADDFEEYVRRATELPYFTWFVEVAARWQRRYAQGDRHDLMVGFRTRLRRSAELHRRFELEGFDARFPIALRLVVRPATTTGKVINRPFFVGDGCHRLALLLASGEQVLSPDRYVVRKDPIRTPIDNTYTLARALPLTEATYFEFLSRGYGQRLIAEKDELLAHVASTDPSRHAELQAVIAVDEPQLEAGARQAAAKAAARPTTDERAPSR